MLKCHSIISGLHCVSEKSTIIYIVSPVHLMCLFFSGCFQNFLFIFDFQQFDYDMPRFVSVLPPLPSTQHFPAMANLAHSSKTAVEKLSVQKLSVPMTFGYLFNGDLFNFMSSLAIIVLDLFCCCQLAWEKRGQKYWHWFMSILPINHNMSLHSSFISSKNL